MSYLKYPFLFFLFIAVVGCNRNKNKTAEVSRTSGTVKVLVDETLANLLDKQIMVFKADYPDAEVETISGNEAELIKNFTSGDTKMMVISRPLKPSEEVFYKNRQSPIVIDRFAIDGIALIVNNNVTDTLITVSEIYNIMKGNGTSNKKLVFDNAQSSTLRYMVDSAGVKEIPKTGVYTLNNSSELIKFISENNDYIGVVGYSWLLDQSSTNVTNFKTIKTLSVKNDLVNSKSNLYFEPNQQTIISAQYPLLRNILIVNAEGSNGLGTGFANWLSSPRGQLIVLKYGLGPHELAERILNINNNKSNKK